MFGIYRIIMEKDKFELTGLLDVVLQMVLEKHGCELVQCNLSLAYDYWPMDEVSPSTYSLISSYAI